MFLKSFYTSFFVIFFIDFDGYYIVTQDQNSSSKVHQSCSNCGAGMSATNPFMFLYYRDLFIGLLIHLGFQKAQK